MNSIYSMESWIMFQRFIKPLKSNSFFLFGPRGSGKTTFLRQFFHDTPLLSIDLLKAEEDDAFSRNPAELERRLAAMDPMPTWVVLDEIQRVPRLLDTVHRLIESTPVTFALTGSSSRKLKRGAANLLAGRAFVNHLHPLTLAETGGQVPLEDLLRWGSLPKAVQLASAAEKAEFLRSYAYTYLREEIAAEQIVRKLDPFRSFLEVAAQMNGQPVNASKIARDVGADTKTVQTYFSILEDTMMGFLLPAWHHSVRKRQATHPRFYFFDTGVKRALERTVGQELYEGSFAYGNAFEHLVILELIRMNDYARTDFRFSWLRSPAGREVDLVVDRPGRPPALIEIKSTLRAGDEDCAAVNAFLADIPGASGYCVSRDPHRKRIGETLCVPYTEIAAELAG